MAEAITYICWSCGHRYHGEAPLVLRLASGRLVPVCGGCGLKFR